MLRARIRELNEERANVYEEMKTLNETSISEKRSLTAEETQKYETLEARYGELRAEKERFERQLERETGEPATGAHRAGVVVDEDGNPEGRQVKAYESYADFVVDRRDALPNATPEYRNAFYAYLAAGARADRLTGEEQRDLSKGTNADGGYTVPTTTLGTIVEKLSEFSVIRALATVLTTGSGEDIRIPLEADIGAADWTAENTEYSNDDIVFGLATLKAWKATTTIWVPRELLTDTVVDLEAYIGRAFGRRMGLKQDAAYVAGDGNGKPTGVLAGMGIGLQKAVDATPDVVGDDVIDLYYSVSPSYRQNAQFVGDTSVLKGLRKEKGSDGQYVWKVGIEAGQPDTLFGKPVHEDTHMPDLAASERVLAFGDWSYVTIRDVAEVYFQRLGELRATKGQVGFLMDHRTDCALLNADALKVIRTGAAA